MPSFAGVVDEVETGFKDAQGFAREVVAKRTAIVAFVTSVALFATNYGFDVSGTVTHWLDIAFTVAGFVATIGVVRPAVTPSSDPRTDSGERLVPESHVIVANHPDAGDKGLTGVVSSTQGSSAPTGT